MKITIRTPQMQDYDRFSAIMDQVQQMHVEWRPDVYKPASPLITKELFGELLKGDSWYIAETDGIVVGVLVFSGAEPSAAGLAGRAAGRLRGGGA